MLLEAGFLAIFLGDAKTKVPVLIIYLLRFELFKTILGAGLIKLRGDPCWRDFSCMIYHYETQPIPNPLSWYFHHTPAWFHQLEVLFTHIIETIVPFFYFVSKFFSAAIAGIATIFFQMMLILSGNFAFLNLLTIVLAFSTLPDQFLRRIIRKKIPSDLSLPVTYKNVVVVVAFFLILLNLFPVLNLLSSRQVMNRSYDPFHFVGTYGMFGSITRPRYEVIIEGTTDSSTSSAHWQEYEFFGKPGRLDDLPSQIAPFHLRLDWLIWFAAFNPSVNDPWFIHFVQKLLQDDKQILSLLKTNPFKDAPPKYIRALRYIYRFTTPEERQKTGNWWKRELVGVYLPPVSLDNQEFQNILKRFGW
jgi:hypothetical protein